MIAPVDGRQCKALIKASADCGETERIWRQNMKVKMRDQRALYPCLRSGWDCTILYAGPRSGISGGRTRRRARASLVTEQHEAAVLREQAARDPSKGPLAQAGVTVAARHDDFRPQLGSARQYRFSGTAWRA